MSRARRALRRAFARLTGEEQRLIYLKFGKSLSIAEIAKVLGANQRVLYRRFERLLRQLRVELETHGIMGLDVLGVLG